MAIALVSAGAVSTGATTTISPSFGASTTANNLLIACIVQDAGGQSSFGTTASGWSVAIDAAFQAAIWYKPNCAAGETAPTFTASPNTPTFIAAVLAEFSGADLTSPLDKTGTVVPSTSPVTIAAASADSTDSNVAISAGLLGGSKSHTETYSDSWTPASGTAGSIGNNGSTKQISHICAVYYLLNTHGGGAADSDVKTVTPSTGTVFSAPSRAVIATFKPPSAFVQKRNPAIHLVDPAVV